MQPVYFVQYTNVAVPGQLKRLIPDKDARKAQNVMQAMMKMRKIIIADLEEAYAQ